MAKYGDPDFNCANSEFVKSCNEVLEREKSPYRFSGVELVPITNEIEVEEITKAQEVPLSASAKHINNAVKAYGDRGGLITGRPWLKPFTQLKLLPVK